MRKVIDKLSLNWRVAFILFGVCFSAYGLFLNQLGFYWDDWRIVYIIQNGDYSFLWEYFKYDRPYEPWSYVALAPILGVKPLYWQLFSFSVRCLTVWLVWKLLNEIWPYNQKLNMWITMLFSVYPTFFQQFLAVTYSSHLIAYALFLLSMYCMMLAYKHRKGYFWLTLVGLTALVLHIFKMEYFLGVELIRPLLLWQIINVKDKKDKLKETIRHWGPYLIGWIVFVVWRIFILELPSGTNALNLIYNFREDMFGTLIEFGQTVVQSLVYMWMFSWAETINPAIILFSTPFSILSWGLMVGLGFVLYFIVPKIFVNIQNKDYSGWHQVAMGIGGVATILGLAPSLIINRTVFDGTYSDRFSMPAMLGASIFVVALIDLAISNIKIKHLVFSTMVVLAVGVQLRQANEYRWDWIEQTRYYWQISWRAPRIEPGTAIISDGAISPYVDRYAASYAFNSIYNSEMKNGQLPYWFFGFGDIPKITVLNMEKFMSGTRLNDQERNVFFDGNSNQSLFINKSEQCIWFMGPKDEAIEEIPLPFRQAASIVNYNLITDQPSINRNLLENILGPQIPLNWCYFYQKAELARQNEDWIQILDLLAEAEDMGFSSKYTFEYLTFIDASIQLGEWDQAVELSLFASSRKYSSVHALCDQWKHHQVSEVSRKAFEDASEHVLINLTCLEE